MNRSLIILATAIFLSLGFYSCSSAQDQPSTEQHQESISEVLSPEEFEALISEGDVQLVDVRTPAEYQQGRIQDAEMVNFSSPDFLEKMQAYDKDQTLYIYCRSGNRSGQAAKKLINDGFTHVIDLQGGILNWSASGKELEKP